MWKYQVNSKKFDLTSIEKSILNGSNVIIELPLGTAKYINLPQNNDEVFLIFLKNARLHGYVLKVNINSHLVCFTEICNIPMSTSRRNWNKLS